MKQWENIEIRIAVHVADKVKIATISIASRTISSGPCTCRSVAIKMESGYPMVAHLKGAGI